MGILILWYIYRPVVRTHTTLFSAFFFFFFLVVGGIFWGAFKLLHRGASQQNRSLSQRQCESETGSGGPTECINTQEPCTNHALRNS